MEKNNSSKSQPSVRYGSELLQLNLIAAVGQNLEIGLDRGMPWNLPNEVDMFMKFTRGSPPPPAGKQNVALLGQKNWFKPDRTSKDFVDPFADLIQIVVSRALTEAPKGAQYVFPTVQAALDFLSQPDQREKIHEVWNIGGHDIYKAGMESPNFHRLYLTRVYGEFKHDEKFPELDISQFRTVRDDRLSEDIQEENGIKYQHFVYEKQ